MTEKKPIRLSIIFGGVILGLIGGCALLYMALTSGEYKLGSIYEPETRTVLEIYQQLKPTDLFELNAIMTFGFGGLLTIGLMLGLIVALAVAKRSTLNLFAVPLIFTPILPFLFAVPSLRLDVEDPNLDGTESLLTLFNAIPSSKKQSFLMEMLIPGLVVLGIMWVIAAIIAFIRMRIAIANSPESIAQRQAHREARYAKEAAQNALQAKVDALPAHVKLAGYIAVDVEGGFIYLNMALLSINRKKWLELPISDLRAWQEKWDYHNNGAEKRHRLELTVAGKHGPLITFWFGNAADRKRAAAILSANLS